MDRAQFLAGRRRLLKVGLWGGLSLLGGSLAWRLAGERQGAYDGKAKILIAALARAMLDGALPEAEAARRQAMASLSEAVGRAIAGLSPAQERELAQLFALLDFSPARFIVAGVRSPWSEARQDEVEAFLRRWRASRLALLRSAYAALHDLVLGAWYALPESWAAIGYPGPPRL